MTAITNNLQLWIAGAIVVIGLVGLGFGDLARFSFKRVWAISSVNFAESIRRRVLWITPLAIVGVVAVASLQKPVDEADGIRQTIKFCLFATGLVVSVVTIILAGTNLPREIDNRVIYTVVTKPTTRLEIVLGKIVGFARVSATILLIMGIFTWGYLHICAWSAQRSIAEKLSQQGDVAATQQRTTLEHYQKSGLLGARTYTWPTDLEVYAHPPEKDDPRRWILGLSEQEILIPFDVRPEELAPRDYVVRPGGELPPPIRLGVQVMAKQRTLTKEELKLYARQAEPTTEPIAAAPLGPAVPGAVKPPAATEPTSIPPRVSINILDRSQFLLVGSEKMKNALNAKVPADPREWIWVDIPSTEVVGIQKAGGRFFVQILGTTVGTQYGVVVPSKPEESPAVIFVAEREGQPASILLPKNQATGQVLKPIFRGRAGNYGQQLRGGQAEGSPVGVYSFRHAALKADDNGKVNFELKVWIEKSGADETSDDDLTKVDVSAVDPATYRVLATTAMVPETNRTGYFQLPAAALNGGNFDVMFRNQTNGHWIGLRPTSLGLVDANDSFGFNLLKSLTILWLMSTLAISVAVFCSTFLSWPIAIVLTIVILLGHWGVEQISDTTDSGFANRFATDMGLDKNAAQAKVVTGAVEGLSEMLNAISTVLPDISKFQASEDVERGISLPAKRLGEALYVSMVFGLPLAVAAYLVLKNKEVAP